MILLFAWSVYRLRHWCWRLSKPTLAPKIVVGLIRAYPHQIEQRAALWREVLDEWKRSEPRRPE